MDDLYRILMQRSMMDRQRMSNQRSRMGSMAKPTGVPPASGLYVPPVGKAAPMAPPAFDGGMYRQQAAQQGLQQNMQNMAARMPNPSVVPAAETGGVNPFEKPAASTQPAGNQSAVPAGKSVPRRPF